MATTFLNSGGDEDFLVGTTNGFWSTQRLTAIATDFVHGGHIKSIKYTNTSGASTASTKASTISDSGARISFYLYLVALPSATADISLALSNASAALFSIRITTGGILQLWNGMSTAQIGTNGATLSTGVWYRISLAYTITSTTVNRFELFVDAVSSISITNATLSAISSGIWRFGNVEGSSVLDMRSSDHYIDDSSSLTDTGDIWVTAKRPNANGTTNGFTTQIGAGGSGVGSGHSPQVNERALSTTNGWSMIGAGAAVTEEYNIESKSAGDIDISNATIIDFVGWVSAKSLANETASIIRNSATTSISLTSTITLFTTINQSPTYPAGTGADIGMITTTALTTVSLYECGVIVAYIPAVTLRTLISQARTLATGSGTSIVDSYSENNQDSEDSTYILDGLGQSFTGDGGVLNSVKFYLRSSGFPTGSAYVKTYAHSGTFGTSSIPTGAALATSDAFDVSTLTTSFQLITFTFSGGNKITLINGTHYVVTIEYANNNTNNIISGIDGSSPTHAGNLCELNTGTWNPYNTYDRCFYVYKDDPATRTLATGRTLSTGRTLAGY